MREGSADVAARACAGLREVTWSGPCDTSETLDPCTTPLMKLASRRPTTRHDPQPACARVCGTPPCARLPRRANHDAPWVHRNVNLKRLLPLPRLASFSQRHLSLRLPSTATWSATRTRPAHQRSTTTTAATEHQSWPRIHRLVCWSAGLLVCWFAGSLVWFRGRVRAIVGNPRNLKSSAANCPHTPAISNPFSTQSSPIRCLLPSRADAPAHGRSGTLVTSSPGPARQAACPLTAIPRSLSRRRWAFQTVSREGYAQYFGQNCTCSAATPAPLLITRVLHPHLQTWPRLGSTARPAHQVEIDLGQDENRSVPEPDPDRRRQNGKTAPDAGAKHAPP